MENGELLAADVLPKVAKEMKAVAAVGLDSKLDTLRVAQGQFFNELEKAGDQVFNGGFSEGLKDLLQYLTEFMRDNQDMLDALGQGFKAIFNIIRVGISIIMPIIDAFTYSLGEVAELFNFLFFGSTEKELLAIGAATYVIVKAVRAMNAALKTQIGLRAASILLNPAALAAVTGALVAEDTLKGAQDRNANTAFNAGTGLTVGNVWHFLTAGFTEDGYSGFFEDYANKLKSQMSPAISLEVKTEEGLDVKVRNIVTQNNAEAKVEVN